MTTAAPLHRLVRRISGAVNDSTTRFTLLTLQVFHNPIQIIAKPGGQSMS
ncbi:hypothetical protein [Crateriforma conspicua]|nr:hypothetical protein [Crateriforma conspicua]